MNFAEIAVAGPLRKTFVYSVPQRMSVLACGQRVLVPFGKNSKIGFYLGKTSDKPGIEIKSIARKIDDSSLFSKELFQLCLWIADYYFCNPADVLATALPAAIRKSKLSQHIWQKITKSIPPELLLKVKAGKKLSASTLKTIRQLDSRLLNKLKKENAIIEIWPDNTRSDFLDSAIGLKSEIPLSFIKGRSGVRKMSLTSEQQKIFDKIVPSLGKGHRVHLLHGVTGSGKTLVYCNLAAEVIKQGKTVLVLTPEITLAGTTLSYLRGFFGDAVAVIHSAMTNTERMASWRGMLSGRYKIAVGPRSALFAPLPNIGFIVVDEEHDDSYKQDEPAPRFQARDSAIMRAKINNIPIMLGSASPSLESYHNAKTGRYELHALTGRPGMATLPKVQIIDMQKHRLGGDLNYLSYPLKKEIENRLEKNQQIILYLNRRGYSPSIKCESCGFVPSCPDCKVNLTFHKSGQKLSCHYCGNLEPNYDICPNCGATAFEYRGVGTQKVEESLGYLFERGNLSRLDSDSARGRTKAYKILSDFAERKHNMLLGTQMVTKGLDLPGVSLVGVLSADQSLDLPDFRATEKSFSRLLQVSGRSGRSDNKGQVLIQTYYPERDVILNAAKQDYISFYDQEILKRSEFSYPPFTRIVNFVLSGTDELRLEENAFLFGKKLKSKIDKYHLKAELLGPAPCPMYFLRKNYRRHLFVKTKQVVKFVQMLKTWEENESRFKMPSGIKVVVDVDPYDMM
ncbi:MAG: primosomal protein N' [candidate division Zixibacteria bacterium]